jgi:hypothetical protein
MNWIYTKLYWKNVIIIKKCCRHEEQKQKIFRDRLFGKNVWIKYLCLISMHSYEQNACIGPNSLRWFDRILLRQDKTQYLMLKNYKNRLWIMRYYKIEYNNCRMELRFKNCDLRDYKSNCQLIRIIYNTWLWKGRETVSKSIK